MDEHFYFKCRRLLKPPKLSCRQLARRYHSRYIFKGILKQFSALRHRDRGLGREMYRKSGKIFIDKRNSADILHDHGVEAGFVIRAQKRKEPVLKLIFFKQCIHGEIHLFVPDVAISDALDQRVLFGIIRIGTCAERRSSDINRVRSRVHRSLQRLDRTCGRKQFKSAHIQFFPFLRSDASSVSSFTFFFCSSTFWSLKRSISLFAFSSFVCRDMISCFKE